MRIILGNIQNPIIMTLLSFLGTLSILLFLSGFINIGWYLITRGEKVQQPDGSFKVRGKLFRAWSLFWERTTHIKMVFFKGDYLSDKWYLLQNTRPKVSAKLDITNERLNLQIKEPLSYTEKLTISEILNCGVLEKDGYLSLYQEEQVYYFPEWIRYPLSQCPPCMASVYGTLLYWPMIILQQDLFIWSQYPSLAAFYFWILFCTALSALNKMIYKLVGVS